MGYLIGFVTGMALSSACLWAVAWWAGFTLPVVDALLIAGLCSGIALFPVTGWFLAMLLLAFLVRRRTGAAVWPDTMVILVVCGVVWIVVLDAAWR